MRASIMVALLALAVVGCSGPSHDAFNDRGGAFSYHMTNSNLPDVLAIADRYRGQFGRKAKLGSPSVGMTSMNVNFECVE